MSINTVTLSGNLGKDPELKQTRSGSNILNLLLAVNDRVKQGDEWTDYTNWVGVVVFGKRADSLSRILAKGTKVCVTGKLRYSTWESDGVKRSKIEVIADDIDIMQKGSQGQQGASQGGYGGNQGNYPQQQYPQQQYAQQHTQQGYQQQGFYPQDQSWG